MSQVDLPLPALTHEPAARLICQECLRETPPAGLQPRNVRGTVLLLCEGCEAALNDRQKLEKQAAEQERVFHQDVVLALNRNASVPTITETVAMLLDKFGGSEAFVDQIYIQISSQFTDDKRKGSPAVMQTCKMLLGMILASTAYQASLPAAAELTDEQVEAELEKMLRKLKTQKRDPASSDNG
jgi:hypothetical protein